MVTEIVVLLTQPKVIGPKEGIAGGASSSLYKFKISSSVKGVFHIFRSSKKPTYPLAFGSSPLPLS